MRAYSITYPKAFKSAVQDYGNPENKAPSGFGNNQRYTNVWHNNWLAQRLWNQYRYARARTTGKEFSKSWFWEEYSFLDWRETARRTMNAEYSGNASYEWFEIEDGEMYKTAWYERIANSSDPRLKNPALDYLFSHLDLPPATAMKKFKEEQC